MAFNRAARMAGQRMYTAAARGAKYASQAGTAYSLHQGFCAARNEPSTGHPISDFVQKSIMCARTVAETGYAGPIPLATSQAMAVVEKAVEVGAYAAAQKAAQTLVENKTGQNLDMFQAISNGGFALAEFWNRQADAQKAEWAKNARDFEADAAARMAQHAQKARDRLANHTDREAIQERMDREGLNDHVEERKKQKLANDFMAEAHRGVVTPKQQRIAFLLDLKSAGASESVVSLGHALDHQANRGRDVSGIIEACNQQDMRETLAKADEHIQARPA
ncbi:hypothetical protein [Telluria beijingensis]|uniref:hypothetical protein n=1 Tax=Telluria beijingensis TaxID=3068633 RepID=UPI0027960217|nr:hypothetical protein [Massilia sp. REN29]